MSTTTESTSGGHSFRPTQRRLLGRKARRAAQGWSGKQRAAALDETQHREWLRSRCAGLPEHFSEHPD
jgi:hypothetical protein